MNWHVIVIIFTITLCSLPDPLVAFIARSTGCHHNGTWYADKSIVPTMEKCLNCACNKKTLVCRLKVCPEMPMPPPRGCVVVQKKHTCCPYLSCARMEAFYKIPITRRIIAYLDHYERESIDRVVNENVLQRRSDDSEVDLQVCVKNGTVYKSGSAMSSSNLCSYCYCIGGSEKCVKPKCMLPVEGCKPIFVDSTCCPVRYDCTTKTSGKSSQEVRYRKASNKHFLRMSQRLQRNRGCTVDGQFYPEGQKMKSDPDKPCDGCFCIRGTRKCAPKKCAPALKNCIPVVPKGQCCPSSYDCGPSKESGRSHNSRQFNLFSLFFGNEGDKTGKAPGTTMIPAQYPHDRHPEITATDDIKKTKLALETSSEKSILDTLREGLEFIDGNTNKLLEENLDLVALQKPEIAALKMETSTLKPTTSDIKSTTEVSFLDLILGPSGDVEEASEENVNNSPDLKNTTTRDELSWVDLLLGPEENKEKSNDEASAMKNLDSESSSKNPLSVDSVADNIDRIDIVVHEDGNSAVGEVDVDKDPQFVITHLGEQVVPNFGGVVKYPIGFEPAISQQAILKASNSETKPNIHIVSTTKNPQSSVHIKPIIQDNNTNPIRPIPLHAFEVIPQNNKEPNLSSSTASPLKNTGFFDSLLDGITDILGPEMTPNNTDYIKVSTSNTTEKKNEPPPIFLRRPPPPPMFRPLPAGKLNERINSKVVNFTAMPPVSTSTKQPIDTTSKAPTTSTSTSKPDTTTQLPRTTTRRVQTTLKPTKQQSTTKATTTSKPTTRTKSTTTTRKATTTSTTTTTSKPIVTSKATTTTPKSTTSTTTTKATTKRPETPKPATSTKPPASTKATITTTTTTKPTTTSASKPQTTPKPSTTSTTTTTTRKTTTMKAVPMSIKTTVKPLIIKTNPTILEAEPLDESTEPTLPPSLPNLKIIPFLPTDAVKSDNKNAYDYYKNSGHEFYDESKIYPSITEGYSSFAVDLDDENKAKYIYKFKIEGPTESQAVPVPAPVAVPVPSVDEVPNDAYLKYDFSNKQGFSPPTKTEGGFVPKDPIFLDDDDDIIAEDNFNIRRSDVLLANGTDHVTMHIIDITTSLPDYNARNASNVIEITTPDPFKDVIHTEPPPDLFALIEDQSKVSHIPQNEPQPVQVAEEEVPLLSNLPLSSSAGQSNPATVNKQQTTSMMEEYSKIEALLDMFLKGQEERDKIHASTQNKPLSTIPPFKTLPESTSTFLPNTKTTTTKIIINNSVPTTSSSTTTTTTEATTTKVVTTKSSDSATNSTKTTKPSFRLKTTQNANSKTKNKIASRRNSTTTVTKYTKNKSSNNNEATRRITTPTTTTLSSSTSISPKVVVTTSAPLLPFIEDISGTVRPQLMSPFDTLPFMDTSFEVKPVRGYNGDFPLPQQNYNPFNTLENLDTPYEVHRRTSTSPTSPRPQRIDDRPAHSLAYTTPVTLTNSLADPAGILKLAGCNIYGRMYRVGRIILELSSACVECKCTEIGVKCGQLDC